MKQNIKKREDISGM